MGNWISDLLPYVWAVPHFLIFVAGLIVAAVNLGKCPRVAVLAGVAFLMLLGSVFASLGLNLWIRHANMSAPGNMETIYFVFQLAVAAVHLVAYSLLVTAVFIDRTAKSPFAKGFAPTK